MNIELIEPTAEAGKETATAIAIRDVAGIVAEFDAVAAGIADLTTKYKDVAYPVATSQGLAEAKAARAAIREPRYKVQNALEAAKAPLNTLKADLTARANQIIGQITPLEANVDAQIKAEEQRKAAEKAAKERAEAEQRAAVDASIAAIRGFAINSVGDNSDTLAQTILSVNGITITLEEFGDRTGEAEQAKQQTIATLKDLMEAAINAEAERAKFAEEQEELRQRQIEHTERERVAREAEATRLAEERKKMDEERAAMRAEQEAMAAERKALADAKALAEREKEDAARAQRAEDEAKAAAARKVEQDAADAAAAVERKRLDDEAAARRAEEQRLALEAIEQRTVQLQEEHEASVAAIKLRDAAPVMLEALRAVVSSFDPAFADTTTGHSKAIEMARAAITLATE